MNSCLTLGTTTGKPKRLVYKKESVKESVVPNEMQVSSNLSSQSPSSQLTNASMDKIQQALLARVKTDEEFAKELRNGLGLRQMLSTFAQVIY